MPQVLIMKELIKDKEEIIGQLLDLLVDKDMDLELEFEDMEVEWGGITAKLSGKTLVAAKDRTQTQD